MIKIENKMKKLRNILILSISCFVINNNKAKAQNSGIDWKIGLGTGYTNYYGDLSPYQIKKWKDWKNLYQFFYYNPNYHSSLSYHINIEKRLTPGIGLKLQSNYGEISMSDRYIKPNGEFDRAVKNWDRSLNFKSTIYDVGLAFVFHSDNGKILSRKAFLAPYIQAGAGLTYFKNYGDLYDNNGMPYDYDNPNVETNGIFETNLRDLQTETNEKYNNLIPYIDLALGLKFRLGNHVSLFLETDIKYAFSDYLDDVSGLYKTSYNSPEQAYAANPSMKPIPTGKNRGNNDGINDFYIFNKIGFNIHLGKKASSFKAGPIYHNTNANQNFYIYQKNEEIKDEQKDIDWKESVDVKVNAQNKEIDNLIFELSKLKDKVKLLEQYTVGVNDSIKFEDLKKSIKILEKEKSYLLEKEYLTPSDSADIIYLDKILHSFKNQLKEYKNNKKIEYSYQPLPDSEKIFYSFKPIKEESNDKVNTKKFGRIYYTEDTTVLENLNTDSLVHKELKSILEKSEQEKSQILKKESLDLNDSLRIEELNTTILLMEKAIFDLKEDKSEYLKNKRIYYYTLAKDTSKTNNNQVDTLYNTENKLENTSSSKKGSNQIYYVETIDSVNKNKIKDSTIWVNNYEKEEQEEINNYQKKINAGLDSLEKLQFKKLEKELAIQKEEKSLQELQLKIDSLDLAQKNLEKNFEDNKKGFFNRFKKNAQEEKQIEEEREMQFSLNNVELEQYKENYRIVQEDLKKLQIENESLKNTLIQDRSRLDRQILSLEKLLYKNTNLNASVRPSLNPIIIAGAENGENVINSELSKKLEELSKRLEVLENKDNLENNDNHNFYKEEDVAIQEENSSSENDDVISIQKSNEGKVIILNPVDELEDKIDTQTVIVEKNEEIVEDISSFEEIEEESISEVDKKQEDNEYIEDNAQSSIESWNVYFELGSTQLSEKEQQKLIEIVDFIKANKNTLIELKGYTDASGTKEVNERIATQRFLNVKTILMERFGIPANRIQLNGINISNKTSANPALDRRVEIKIVFK